MYFNPAYRANSEKCENDKFTSNVKIDNCFFE